MASELALERCELPNEVKEDMQTFISGMHLTDQEIKNLKINDVTAAEIQNLLTETYL